MALRNFHLRLKILKCSWYIFQTIPANLYDDIVFYGGIQAIMFLAIAPALKIWHFEILTWK